MNTFTHKFLGLVGACLVATAASAQTALDGSSINGGGGTSSNGVIAFTATIGQPCAGLLNGGSSTINSGFWGRVATDPPVDPQELIVNGSFENAVRTFVPDPNGVMSVPPGSGIIPGWTIVRSALVWGGINDGGAALPSGPGTPFGHFYVDLTGSLDTLPFAGVTQTIPTSPNQDYTLSFALGTVENDLRWRGPISVIAMAGSSSNEVTFTPTGTGWQWQTFTSNFTATSTSTPVTLLGNTAAGYFIALDNVSVKSTVVAAPLRIGAVAVSGNQLRFSFPANSGHTYAIQSRTGLTAGAWATVPGTTTTGNGATTQVAIPIPPGQPRQFYRVTVLP